MKQSNFPGRKNAKRTVALATRERQLASGVFANDPSKLERLAREIANIKQNLSPKVVIQEADDILN